MKRIIERHQERLQALNKICQQARQEHEHLMQTQHKLKEDLIATIDWFKRLTHDLSQPIEINLSLNSVTDLQDSILVRYYKNKF